MSQDPKNEQAHRERIEHYVFKVQQLYDNTIAELILIASTITTFKKGKIFSFSDYPKTNDRLKKLLQKFVTELSVIIEKGTTDEWFEASKKKDTRLPMTDIYNARNKAALQAFQNRGINISDRVWNLKEHLLQEVEIAISDGIEQGTSAKELTKNVKQYLNEPDKLFRRVRDKFGVLQLSKKAKAYKAGQGVYRSSYKNALRLTRTEINMAYRASDHYRWGNDRSVIGFEVKLSNRHVVRDICDDLKGKYPKTFLFRGWHPQCLCYKVPILMNDSDFEKLQQSILDGQELPKDYNSKGEIKQLPQNFKEWTANNKERAKNWKNTPFFISDNFKNGELP